jgi:hypothetical protein
MAAVANGGQVYVSQDSGTNWTARATAQLWNSIAVSADGSKMVASVYGGTLYTSADKGTNWTSVASPRLWNSVASSPDGVKLVATEVQGAIWMSADGGATWVANTAAGNRNWSTVVMSADGSRLLAGVTGGKLYRSLDGGVSWTELAGNNAAWSGIAFPASAANRNWNLHTLTLMELAGMIRMRWTPPADPPEFSSDEDLADYFETHFQQVNVEVLQGDLSTKEVFGRRLGES